MVTTKTNTHADLLLGSRWAQMWVYHVGTLNGNILVYVTKGKRYKPAFEGPYIELTDGFGED